MLKTLLLKSSVLTLACSMSLLGYAMADEPRLVNVPAGDLVTALETLAQQSGAELIYQVAQLKGMTTKGVHGVLSVHDAVTLLLSGTKLKVTTADVMPLATKFGMTRVLIAFRVSSCVEIFADTRS